MENIYEYYSKLNSLIWRAIYQFPINAAYRASIRQREVMFIDPRDNPSRSQKVEGYTQPFQVFASSNVWQTPSGQQSRGRRQRIPSLKYIGPRATIPTAMPWDL